MTDAQIKIIVKALKQYKAGNYIEAMEYCLEISDVSKEACLVIGYMFEDGNGVRKDTRLAFEWENRSAEMGEPAAQYVVGMHYLDGDIVKKNIPRAMVMLERAAEQGDVDSLKLLSKIYQEGYYVLQDLDKARRYDQMALKKKEEKRRKDTTKQGGNFKVETTNQPHGRVNEVISSQINSGSDDSIIDRALTLFNHIHMDEASREELRRYFRYRSRKLPQDDQIQYNFYVHSTGSSQEMAFISAMEAATHLFDDNRSTKSYRERDFLDKGYMDAGSLGSFRTYAIFSCLTQKEYLPNESGFSHSDAEKWDSEWDMFLKICKDSPQTCKILCASEAATMTRLRYKDELYNVIFRHHIHLQDMSPEEIMTAIEKELTKRNIRTADSFAIDLQKYVETIYSKANYKNEDLVEDIVEQILASYYGSAGELEHGVDKNQLPVYKPELSWKEQLNQLVGLGEVKKKIYELESYVRYVTESRKRGQKCEDINLHMLFVGNPGTGKTTVARIIAQILYEIGVLKKNKVVETERKDLVGQYIGHTALKTAAVIDKAMGGVLFIDEAYSLVPEENGRDFGHEAIETLIKAMEDRKGQFVVILAGYRDEMQRFVDSNPGIASRIGYKFIFEDYSPRELMELYKLDIKREGLRSDDKATEQVEYLLRYYGGMKNSGNGRFVRNLVQSIRLKHAVRVMKIPENERTDEDFERILLEDIPNHQELVTMTGQQVSPKDEDSLAPEDRGHIAVHEMGHALASYLNTNRTDIESISILAQNDGTIGKTVYAPAHAFLISEQDVYLRIVELEAGGIAEMQVYKSRNSDWGMDYKAAQQLAKEMLKKFSRMSYGADINTILKNARGDAATLISKNLSMLKAAADNLEDKRSMKGDEVDSFFASYQNGNRGIS